MLIRGFLVLFAVYFTGYGVAGLAVAVLLLIWALLGSTEGPPVLAIALLANRLMRAANKAMS